MHAKDKQFLEKAVALIHADSLYKTSETLRRIKCIVPNPPLIDISTVRQIQLMKDCKMSFNVRDREFYFDFYKEGEVVSRKRQREPDPVKHPFNIQVHADDQKVVDSVLNTLCSCPNLCLFAVEVHKGDVYDLEVHNIETIPYTIVDKIFTSLSTFVSNIVFDFPNQRIHFYIKRNDNL
jgi:hypothetical protein|tara:strand:+ start:8400 stop:8936 length:537 start_codon:yes stop_codon:yes gene_type:complete